MLRDRRPSKFRLLMSAACAAAVLTLAHCGTNDRPVFVQEPLAYPQDALAPFIGADTVRLHYEAHYAGYVKKANQLAAGTRLGARTPEDLIRAAAADPAQADLFNNAAQAWNHAFFFKCLKPGGGLPQGELAERLDARFGGFAGFRKALLAAARDQFGSGWVWLVSEGDTLTVTATADADTPLVHGQIPLLAVDLWEHAYYLDYQNRREAYVQSVLENLVDWDFVAAQFEKAMLSGSGA
jgi:Fe-Mn family superoxide dismutase